MKYDHLTEYLEDVLKTINDDKLILKIKRKTIKDGSDSYLDTLKDKMFYEKGDY